MFDAVASFRLSGSLSATLVAAGVAVSCSVYDASLLPHDAAGALSAAGRAVQPFDAATAAIPVASRPESSFSNQRDAPASGACVQATGGAYCSQLPHLRGAHTIDAALECGLTLEALGPANWRGDAPAPNLQAAYAAAWSAEGLYVYIEVHGQRPSPHALSEPVFCGDAAEIYVDNDAHGDDAGTYDTSGTVQFVVAAPAQETSLPDAARFIQGQSAGPWVSTLLHVKPLTDGYAIEAVVSAVDLGLWQWTPADRVGFSVAVDVAGAAPAPDVSQPSVAPVATGPCTQRLGQFLLRVADAAGPCYGEPWCDARAFCSPVLVP